MLRKYYLPLLFAQLFWLAAAQAGSISGSVTNRENGAAIAGAHITAVKVPFDSTFGNAFSDSMGNYTISSLPAGKYHMRAAIHDAVVEDTALVTVIDSTATTGVNFQFGRPPHPLSNTITGRISDGSNHHGISGATTTLSGNGAVSFTATADSDGRYSFSNLTPGWYTFSAAAEGYESFTANHQLMIGADTHLSGVNAELRPSITYQTLISGHVYDSLTGAPLAGAVIFDNVYNIRFDSLHQHFAWTDSSGGYTLRNVPVGSYTLTARHDGYLPSNISGVSVVANETTVVDFQLSMPSAGTISGNVSVGSGNPLRGAHIQFVPATPGVDFHERGAITDSNGNYSGRVAPGQYYVACAFENHEGHLWKWYDVTGGDGKTAVNVSVNETTSGIDFNFTPPRKLHIVVTGQVTDVTGATVRGARISAGIDSMLACSDNDGVAATKSDSSGNYTLTLDVPARDFFRFALSARKPGYQVQYYNGQSDPSKADIFTISSDSALNGVNFSLDTVSRQANSISGTVTNSLGAPVAHALVSAHGKITRSLKVAITDSLGNYSITDLFPERYIVLFSANGYVSEMYDNAHTWEDATPVLAQGAVNGINASLETFEIPDSVGGSLIGTVRDDHDTLLAGATIALVRGDHHVVRTTVSLSDGSFSILHVLPGQYRVVGAKAGYTSATAAVTIYGADSGATSVDLVLPYKAPSAPITVGGGWSIVSLPMHVGDGSSTRLFPGFDGHLFRFGGTGYGSSDQITHGIGYWMKNGSSVSYDIEGGAILAETVEVHQGWNLIGALSLPIAVSSIKSTTPGFVVSQFYGYNGSAYSVIDTLYPGYGYWLKVATPGTLIISLNATPSMKPVTVARTNDAPPAAPEASSVTDTRPATFSLNQNYPNPFNPSTMIQYEIPVSGMVTVKVYNVLGIEVATLVNGTQDAGSHQITWDAGNLASGVYFYKLTAAGTSTMKKMMLLR